ncbi:TonB-dependent receptor [Roseovarius sp. SYSU LYC5161]|uniref:TonB-dependent receptor n=1 Tax=Roseovarius halophilus (ex Wu et al. 2025) TaxID=3376060 RepID=UPI00399C17DF
MKQKYAIGLAATLAGLLSTTALAQQTGDGAATDLGTLVITGAPTASNIEDLPADVDAVAGEEKRKRQSGSLGDTLDHLSGVDTIATGTNVGKPVLRGFSGNRVRVLSNGIGLDFQQFGVRHMPTVDPFIAERIEVVRGAQSLLYGSGAIGGAVNLLPALPPTGPEGEWTLNGETTLQFQSAHEQATGVQKFTGANGRLGFAATLVGRYSGGLNTPDGSEALTSGNPRDPLVTGSVPFTDYEQFNGDINIGYMTDIGQVRLRYERYRDEHNFVVPDPPPPNGNPLRPGGVGQDIENELVQLDADLSVNETWTLKPTLSFATNLRVSNPGPPEPLPRSWLPGAAVLDIRRDTLTARLEAEHTGLFGALDGRIGVEAVNTDQSSRGSTILSPGGQVENYALFAFEEAEMGKLKVNFGGRLDYRETRLDLGQTQGTFTNGPPPVGQRENDYLVGTWGLGASYAVTDALSFMGNLSRGFRAPNLFELYADGVHGGVAAFQQGDPTLDEETSISVDAGVRWESDKLSAKVTGYYNDIEDYIFLAGTGNTAPNGLPIFRVSQQNAETYGVDATLEGRPLSWLTWRTTIGWVDGELADGTQVPLLPPLKISGEVTFHEERVGAFEDAYLTLGARYAGAQDSAGLLEPFGQFDSPPPPFGTASTDDYVLLDATVGGSIGDTGTEVEFGVENILDEEYRDFLDTYKNITLGPGRNWTLRVTQQF